MVPWLYPTLPVLLTFKLTMVLVGRMQDFGNYEKQLLINIANEFGKSRSGI